MTKKQLALANEMSGISQECLYAAWISGCEYDIWNAIVTGNRKWVDAEMSAESLATCKRLSGEIGGWITWGPGDHAQRFVKMPDWLRMFSDRRGRQPAHVRP